MPHEKVHNVRRISATKQRSEKMTSQQLRVAKKKGRPRKANYEAIIALRKKQRSLSQIAREVNVSLSTVQYALYGEELERVRTK